MTIPFDNDQIAARIEAGLGALELELSAATVNQLVRFTGELHRWNQAYNLTAVCDPVEMVARHLLDSLTALPVVTGAQVLDVGCGAGLPGFPLALVNPEQTFWLLDSNAKKQRFVEHICRELALKNVRPVHARVETFAPAERFDTIICRALATLDEFVRGSGHLLKPDGHLVAMKGKFPEDEIAALSDAWSVTEVRQVEVPSLAGDRHLVEIRANDNKNKT